MKEITITAENFEKEVLQSKLPVLVDFWATWCGPCQMLSPVLSEIADEYDNKIKIGKINVDEESTLAEEFNIDMIPCMILFVTGKQAGKIVGYRDKKTLLSDLKQAKIL